MLVRRMNKQVSMQYSVSIVHANRKSEEAVRDRGGGDNYMKTSGEALRRGAAWQTPGWRACICAFLREVHFRHDMFTEQQERW